MQATFFGDDEFPIEWADGQKELFWVYDDLHIPNPVSPLYADIGGWWLTCDYMFRRFGTPFACDWLVKVINGYVYTAAIPAKPGVSAVGSAFGARYTARTPIDSAYSAQIGDYLGWTLPYYADHFLDWWRERFIPEMERNFFRFDTYDYDRASLLDLAVLLEDVIDMHERHWKIHWQLNFSQFFATMALNQAIAELKGEANSRVLVGRLQASTENRNWDSINGLWQMKELVKADLGEVAKAFKKSTPADVLSALKETTGGRTFIAERLDPYLQVFGYKSMFAHEFSFKTWKEDPAPVIDAIRGYLQTDYDFRADIERVGRDLEAAKTEVMKGVPAGEVSDKLARALELSLKMNPLTPDHHFYIDQGTNARVRLVLIAVGEKLVAKGVLLDPEDVMYLYYNELRAVMAGSFHIGVSELISDRRDQREDAYKIRPRDWVGTATDEALAFPYLTNWGFPEKFHRKPPESDDIITGLPASTGVVEGNARVLLSPEEFASLQKGEIAVCQMTSPAWVVLFTRIGGLVTDAGGMASHPAVLSREFAIPAVVGTSDATRRINTGDRVRVNGSTGQVFILSTAEKPGCTNRPGCLPSTPDKDDEE
jgi:phosphohistidine swiveling domain-containing protein